MKWLSKTYVWLMMAFLYMPIGVLIAYSFNQSKSRSYWTGFTLKWYKDLFHNEQILSSLRNTLIIAVVASVVATILGTAAAIGIDKFNKKLRSIIINITYIPIINPEIVTGVSLMLLFVFLRFEFGFSTLIIAHITFNLPYVILNVLPKLKQMDKFIYEAALDLGCSPFKAFFKVVVPEIMPGIISGFLMAFTYSLDDFVVSYFNTGAASQTLSITIFSMTRRKVSPEINALSTIIFIVVLSVLLAVNIYNSRKEKNSIRAARKEREA